MKVRLATLTLALGLVAAPVATDAQPAGKIHRVGWLSLGTAAMGRSDRDAFVGRLRELGYAEGQNLILVERQADGKAEQLPRLASELVGLKVDVIVTVTTPAAQAAKEATSTIPVVMAGSADPVARGLVASLARPGGNVTGVTNNPGREFVGKQLQLLKELAPGASRVALVWNPAFAAEVDGFADLQGAGRSLGMTILSLEIKDPTSFDPSVIVRERADGLVVFPNSLNWIHRQAILDLAAKHALPAIYGERDMIPLGGLVSYWTNWLDLRRRAAVYVDRILKGAKPADLPVEQPARFELVINRKTAKALGLTLSQSVLVQADEVIE